MSFRDELAALIRLEILIILSKDRGGSLNHEMMRLALEHHAAHSLTNDQVRTEFLWLESQGLVRVEEVGHYLKATLLHLGRQYLARGAVVDGIAPPPDPTE